MSTKQPPTAAPGNKQLRPKGKPAFPPTRPEDVQGSLAYKGKPKTLEEMDAGIVAEVKRRHARGSILTLASAI